MARLDTWQDVEVGAHVHGFFLAPEDFSVGVSAEFAHDKVEGEGSELFDAHDGDLVVEFFLFAHGVEVVVDLATAEHEALDFGVGLRAGGSGGGV